MDIDNFVNSNRFNVKLDIDSTDFDDIETAFLDRVDTEMDDSNDDAFPVMVYTRGGVPVAWLDLENAVGYAS